MFPYSVDIDDSLYLTCEAVAKRECVIVKIKMICFSQFGWERETERKRERFLSYLHSSI